MRLIDADAAIEAVEKSMYENPHENAIHRSMHDHEHRHFLTILMGLPSIQPDIIRCKDCAYCDSDVIDAPYGMTKKVWWCNRLYAGANENLTVEPDDFCSWAKRKVT